MPPVNPTVSAASIHGVLTGWALSICATGVACVAMGIVVATRRDERSWMVAAATLLGFLPVALLLTEVALGTFPTRT